VLRARLAELSRSLADLGEVGLPLGSFLWVEVIEPTGQRRPGHGAVAGVVLIGTEGPGDRLLSRERVLLGSLDDR